MKDPFEEFDIPREEDFPTNEADIIRLAQRLSALFRARPDLFPSPPVAPDEIDRRIAQYHNANERRVVSLARAERAHARKNASLDELIALLGGDPAESAPADEPPGQVGFLEIVRREPGTMTLAWQPPRDGGAVGVYFVQSRSSGGEEEWGHASASVTTEATVTVAESPREFRVIAVNRIDHGLPSNVVRSD